MTEKYRIARNVLIHLRRLARTQIATYNLAANLLKDKRRTHEQLQRKGITFLPLVKEIQTCRSIAKTLRHNMVETGEQICLYLDIWQKTGATLKDLCDLCAKPYHKALQEIASDRLEESFSGIMYVHNLDYQHDFSGNGFYSMEIDAPFSHCLRTFFTHLMTTNPECKAVAKLALEECFPEIMENVLYPVTDEDGVTRMYDKDGFEVTTTTE